MGVWPTKELIESMKHQKIKPKDLLFLLGILVISAALMLVLDLDINPWWKALIVLAILSYTAFNLFIFWLANRFGYISEEKKRNGG